MSDANQNLDEKPEILVENPYHPARYKPARKGKKPPRLLAIVHQSGCTGCEVCIAGCPVDSIEVVPGPNPDNPTFGQLVEIDLSRCIGCQNCSYDCPWETITMYETEDAFIVWARETLKSELYVNEEKLHEINLAYGIELESDEEEEEEASASS